MKNLKNFTDSELITELQLRGFFTGLLLSTVDVDNALENLKLDADYNDKSLPFLTQHDKSELLHECFTDFDFSDINQTITNELIQKLGSKVELPEKEEWFYNHDNEWQNDIEKDFNNQNTTLSLVEWAYNQYH